MAEIRLEQIPLDKIYWAENERKHFDSGSLATLSESIRAQGLKQPIGVVAEPDDRYRGLWGQRRLKAASLAGLLTIPAIIHPAPRSAIETAEIRICENVARENITPMELAIGLHRLLSAGGTAAQVASRIGMTGPAVSRSLSLLKLSPAIQQLIQDGKINAAAGYELAQIDSLATRDELAIKAAEGKLTRDDLIARRRRPAAANTKSQSHAAVSRVTAKLADGRSVTVYAPDVTMEVMIDTLEQTLLRAKQAHKKGLQLHTFIRVLRDTARS